MAELDYDDDESLEAPPPAYTPAYAYPPPIIPRLNPPPQISLDLSNHIRRVKVLKAGPPTISSPETSTSASTSDDTSSPHSAFEESNAPRYLYYRVFSADGAIRSRSRFEVDDPYTGRVLAAHITPPHNAQSIKRLLCRQEHISNADCTNLFASTLTSELELNDEDRPGVLLQDGPGSCVEDPMALIIKDSRPPDRSSAMVRLLLADSDHARNSYKPFSSKASQLQRHKKCASSVAFSPDGAFIASGSEDNTICVWDVATGRVTTGPIPVKVPVLSVAFSPDGQWIVSGCQSQPYIRIWNAQVGIPVSPPQMFQGHTKSVNSVIFSPDGQRIASGSSDMTVRIWDTRLGIELCDPLQGHTDAITSIAISPDGLRIASGSADSTVRVWDIKSAALVVGPLRGHSSKIQCIAFSPRGRWLASSSNDRDVRVWDTEAGKSCTTAPLMVSRRFTGHTNWVVSVAFSPDGQWIISGSRGTIIIWKLENGHTVTTLAPPKSKAKECWVVSTAISSQGHRIVVGTFGGSLYMWTRK